MVSDSGSDAECSEALVSQPRGGRVTEQPHDFAEEGIARDTESVMSVEGVGAKYQVVQDEADDAMEAIVKRELKEKVVGQIQWIRLLFRIIKLLRTARQMRRSCSV